MIFYIHSVSYRRGTPGDIDVKDSLSLLNGAGNSLIGERTNIRFEDDPPREKLQRSVPVNKGNVAQVTDNTSPSKEKKEKKEVKDYMDYPENGEEIRPPAAKQEKKVEEKENQKNNIDLEQGMKEVKTEMEERLTHKLGTKSDKLSAAKDGEKVEAISAHVGEGLAPHGSASIRASEQDLHKAKANLYVRSSMPLGHALKILHTERQEAVVEAFKHAWSSYKKYAWGEDDLLPMSKTSSSVDYGMAMTMVDSLDTLWLMGLQEEFDEARAWLDEHFNLDLLARNVVVFEVNIRVLGGLLSAYHLSGDDLFLQKAVS